MMKIHSKDFRVGKGDEVDLKKWPTKVDPVYKSKKQYKELLEEHVAQLRRRREISASLRRTPSFRLAAEEVSRLIHLFGRVA